MTRKAALIINHQREVREGGSGGLSQGRRKEMCPWKWWVAMVAVRRGREARTV